MDLFNIGHRLTVVENQIKSLGEKMVPLQTGYTDLTNAVNSLSTEQVAVSSAIAALQAQVAAGSPVTGEQLEALAVQVNGITANFATSIAPTGISTGTSTSTTTSTSTSS
jgi:hypothetical protein